MYWRITLLCIALLTDMPIATAEENLNVQTLLRDCKQPEDSGYGIFCLGFISGIGGTMQAVGEAERRVNAPSFRQLGICSTGKISNGAMVQAFINWAEKNPQQWQKEQWAGVVVALRETWPCRGQVN
jgi:hypothetical protein